MQVEIVAISQKLTSIPKLLTHIHIKWRNNMQAHPEEFGFLFQTIEADEDFVALSLKTNLNHAVAKFGQDKVLEVMEKKFMKPINDFCKKSNLLPFMIAASYEESIVCAIYHLLRPDLSWMGE